MQFHNIIIPYLHKNVNFLSVINATYVLAKRQKTLAKDKINLTNMLKTNKELILI